MLKICGLSKRYKKGKKHFDAIADINIEIGKCQTVGLVGDSGSGKSTIATIVAGLTKPTAGAVAFNGETVRFPFKKSMRRQIQILFQHPEVAFNPKLKIIDSLKEPYQLYKKGYKMADIVADINDMGLQEQLLYRYPVELSGGEQQRLALVRALTIEPDLLILDEPTSMLDVVSQAMIIDILKKYQRRHQTSYLFISHNEVLADIFCDNIYYIEEGRIVDFKETDGV